MSFILEALNRAHQERKGDAIPPAPPPEWMNRAPRRKIWPWFVSAALIAGGLALAVLLWPQPRVERTEAISAEATRTVPVVDPSRAVRPTASSRPELTPSSMTQPPVSAVPMPARPAAAVTTTRGPAAASGSSPPTPSSAQDHAESFRPPVRTETRPPQGGMAAVAMPRASSAGEKAAGDAAPGKQTAQTPRSLPSPNPDGRTEPPIGSARVVPTASGNAPDTTAAESRMSQIREVEPTAEPVASVPQAGPKPPATVVPPFSPADPKPAAPTVAARPEADPIPALRQLPQKVQERLGSLQLDAHVYSPDPSQRFVFINGQSYRVGQRVEGNGPIVSAITVDGVILDYGEGKASLQVGR